MDAMNGQKSVPMSVTINDILDELMSENKRLFNELLFANKCLNELKTHLNNIHTKYQTIIECEDIRRWDQLNGNTLGIPIAPQPTASQDLTLLLNLNTNCLQLITQQSLDQLRHEISAGQTSSPHKSPDDCSEDINGDQQYRCSVKDCNQVFKQKYELNRHSVTHRTSLPLICTKTIPPKKILTLETQESKASLHLRYNSADRFKCLDVKTNQFICPINGCGKGFTIDRCFLTHLNRFHSNQRYVCQYKHCNKMYKSYKSMSRHIVQHNQLSNQTNKKRFECSYNDCNYQTFNIKFLIQHMKTHSTAKQAFRCDVVGCAKTFISRASFVLHKLKHNNEMRFKTISGQTNEDIDDMSCVKVETNLKAITNNELNEKVGQTIGDTNNGNDINVKQRYECTFKGCNKSFSRNYSLRCHSRTAHTADGYIEPVVKNAPKDHIKLSETPETQMSQHLGRNREDRYKCLDETTETFICPIGNCGKSFETDRLFTSHLRRSHTTRRIVCPYKECHKVLKSMCALKAHLVRHTSDTSGQQFKCLLNGCSYETYSEKLLAKHTAKHSADDDTRPMISCDREGCTKIFRSKCGYDRHVQRQHDKKKPIECNYEGCGERFYDYMDRRKHHTLAHNREPMKRVRKKTKKPCDWPGCEWIGVGLVSHKRLHTGDKPHPCHWPGCDKRFTHKIKLTEHMNVHNNVKPYGCQWPGCDYRSANSANIVKHKKQVHYN